MSSQPREPAISRHLPLLLVFLTTLLALVVGIISLLSGWMTIFQNLFYIPIILACFYYLWRGFVFSVVLSGTYLVLIVSFSSDPLILEGALIRGVIFIVVAGVITYISHVRMQSEEALRESEARYSALFDNSYSVSLLIDPETGRIVDANDAACQYYGYTREQFLTRVISDLNHLPEAKVIRDLQRAKQEGKKHFFSTHYLAGGERRNVEIYSGPITVQGRPLFYSVIHDITERKRAEEALRVSEARYRELFQNMGSGVAVYQAVEGGGNFIFKDFNRAAEAIEGIRRPDLIGRKVTEIFPGARESGVFDAIQRVWKTGEAEFFPEYVYRDSRLLETWREAWFYRLPDGDVVTVYNDITRRKHAERELSASKNLIESIIDLIPARVFWKDRNLVYLGCNTQFAQDAGFSHPGDVIGKDDFQMGWRDQADLYRSDDRDVIESGESKLFIEEPQTTPLGTTIQLLTSKVPLRNIEGEIIGVLGAYLDITDRKRAEEALRMANKKLNLLGSTTRHDITNQLTVVSGYLNLMHKELADQPLSDYFGRITRAVDRIMVILQFSRTYEQLGIHAPAWQDVRNLIDHATRAIAHDRIGVENELPPGTAIYADPMVLTVFSNLIDNAVRHGETITRITFSSGTRGDTLVIVCSDDGVGIPREEKEMIFTRGFGRHTGLGLFLAREILAITKITITENGDPGKGARFEMVVPKGVFRVGE